MSKLHNTFQHTESNYYDIPEHFKNDNWCEPYSFKSMKHSEDKSLKFYIGNASTISTTNIMHLFSKKIHELNKQEKKLRGKIETFELECFSRLKPKQNNTLQSLHGIIETLKADIHKIQIQKIEYIKKHVIPKLKPDEIQYVMNLNISFLNFPDDDEIEFMLHLQDILFEINKVYI